MSNRFLWYNELAGYHKPWRVSMDPLATIIITIALIFYSIGVWSERIQGRLKSWHLVFFVLGLVCDTWGTGLMLNFSGGLTFDLHGVSGFLAIILMFIHAAWALAVLIRNDEKALTNFHKFSLFVWLIWLIPYFSPMIFGLSR
jgi:uncharacterized repeat protein (TIGR03987 family)